jgi:DnaJ-class molecular chaperone
MVFRRPADYYAALRIRPDATIGQIKRAYREMALLCHPDRVGEGGAEAFMLIRKAYETLSDASLRRAYDMESMAAENMGKPSPIQHDMRFVASRIRKRKWWEDPLKSRSVSLLTKRGKCGLCSGAGVIRAKLGPPRMCWMCMGTGKRGGQE